MKKQIIITLTVAGIILSFATIAIYGKNNRQESLSGDDLNNNGIRDDIENYIDTKFCNSIKLNEGLKQYAISIQKGILSTNEQESMLAADSLSRAMECLHYIAPDTDYWKDITSHSINTPERLRASMAHEARLSGKVFSSRPVREWKTSCNFNSDKLKD